MKENALVALLGVLSLVFGNTAQASPPPLLPFQGRLTHADGSAITDGPRLVQFKIYDAPVGGQAVWNGEVQKLTVNGGLANTLLGTKVDLSRVDFDRPLYLEITVDADADNEISLADPPLLPRQTILPAVFAKQSANGRKLAGHDWGSLLSTNDPVKGTLPGSKISAGTVTFNQLADATVITSKVDDGAITLSKLAQEVKGMLLSDGAIAPRHMSKSAVNSAVPAGTIVAFGGATSPDGWLLCDGTPYNRGDYPDLFAAIRTFWGTGPLDTTFRVPDLRGFFLRGIDRDAGRDPDKNGRVENGPGGQIGNQVGSVQYDAFQGHWHDLWVDSDADGALSGQTRVNRAETSEMNVAPKVRHVRSPVEDGQNGTPRTAGETRPKNAYVNYIIKY